MKRKFIVMPVLIQGPKQPGNDIDVYLRPLIEELILLWSEIGVRVWDEYKQEHFYLRALLFMTINDWPALSNLSGQTNKVYNACTHCFAERSCTLGIVGFFLSITQLEKKGKHFKGKADHRCKPRNRTREDIFEMVKDVKVVFGKGQGSQPVPKDAAGCWVF